jgi:hypothetical protein
MAGDPQCARLHGNQPVSSEEFVVGPQNEVKWVFVYVKEGVRGTFNPPPQPMVLDQKGCIYRPHVFGLMVGQTLEVLNSDPLLHNVHAFPKKNRPFNVGQPLQGKKDRFTFDVPEVMIPIKCDVHTWMVAYCGVLPHPFFAVTGSDGRYTIRGLPPGTYTLEAWHERLGTRTQTVTVRAGETVTVNFILERQK